MFQLTRRGAGRVLVATFVTLGLTYGFWYAYSVFLVAFLREFGWSRSTLAGAFSLLVMMHGLSGPPLGWLVERFGPRAVIATGGVVLAASLWIGAHVTAVWHLYVTFGVLAALGVSAAGWVPSVVLIRGWFPAQVGTAIGMASAGIGVGIFALVPFTQMMIDWFGWRWALRVLGVLALAWIVPATLLLVRSARAEIAPAQRDATSPVRTTVARRAYWTPATVVRSWRFWGVGTVFFAGSFATQMLLVHQVAYLVDHGVSALVGATVVGIVGVASVIGKAGWGTCLSSDSSPRACAQAKRSTSAIPTSSTCAAPAPSVWTRCSSIRVRSGARATARRPQDSAPPPRSLSPSGNQRGGVIARCAAPWWRQWSRSREREHRPMTGSRCSLRRHRPRYRRGSTPARPRATR